MNGMAVYEGWEAVNRLIRGGVFAGAYFVRGDGFLVDYTCKAIVRRITGCSASEDPFEKYPFDCFSLEGPQLGADGLIDLAERLPVQTDRLCIVVRDYPFVPKRKQAGDEGAAPSGGADSLRCLYNYLLRLPDTTVIIFADAAGEFVVDEFASNKRSSSAKTEGKKENVTSWRYVESFFSSKGGMLCPVADAAYARSTVARGVQSRNKAAGRNVVISDGAADLLVSRVGSDLMRLRTEIDKLYSAAQGDEITEQLILELVAEDENGGAFDIVRSISEGNYDRAFRIIRALMLDGAKPELITGSIMSAFADAYRWTLVDKYRGGDQTEYHDAYGKWLRRDNRLPGFTQEQLKQIIDAIVGVDIRSKSMSAGAMGSAARSQADFDELLAVIINIHEQNNLKSGRRG